MFLHSLSSFFDGYDLIWDNKREAKHLPYNQVIFHHRRGGVSPPAFLSCIASAAMHYLFFYKTDAFFAQESLGRYTPFS